MTDRLLVQTAPNTQIPYVIADRATGWELVDYLAARDVLFSYRYENAQFTIYFLWSGATEAQRHLDDWSCYAANQEAAERNARRFSSWIVGRHPASAMVERM